jgi:hypothetical protein
VLVVETFVDVAQFCGTLYSASGWSELGQTDGSTVIGLVDIRSMVLPLTNTSEGVERAALLPLKMRTFWNNVPAPLGTGVG